MNRFFAPRSPLRLRIVTPEARRTFAGPHRHEVHSGQVEVRGTAGLGGGDGLAEGCCS